MTAEEALELAIMLLKNVSSCTQCPTCKKAALDYLEHLKDFVVAINGSSSTSK